MYQLSGRSGKFIWAATHDSPCRRKFSLILPKKLDKVDK